MRTAEELSYLSEQAIQQASDPGTDDATSTLLLAEAQVWATLALASATKEAERTRSWIG